MSLGKLHRNSKVVVTFKWCWRQRYLTVRSCGSADWEGSLNGAHSSGGDIMLKLGAFFPKFEYFPPWTYQKFGTAGFMAANQPTLSMHWRFDRCFVCKLKFAGVVGCQYLPSSCLIYRTRSRWACHGDVTLCCLLSIHVCLFMTTASALTVNDILQLVM